ncbi:MAG: diaminopimelate epimerase [Bacillota bacterium]
MMINFTKMHGAGNDFVLIDSLHNSFHNSIESISKLAIRICDRHTGIGGDGIILVLPVENKENDFRMRIFNSDGSEAEMCGNGIRCFTHFLREELMSKKNTFRIETRAGIIQPEIISYNNKESQVKVNMGIPRFRNQEIPVLLDEEYIKNYDLLIDDQKIKINCVSMGNPHTIIFVKNLDSTPVIELGKKIENHKIFPEKTNVEFIEVLNRNEILMKVWERGAGLTLACGTGACAAVVAGINNNLLNQEVLVHLPGGDLNIEWYGKDVFMTGPAEQVFKGEIEL